MAGRLMKGLDLQQTLQLDRFYAGGPWRQWRVEKYMKRGARWHLDRQERGGPSAHEEPLVRSRLAHWLSSHATV